MSEARIFIVTCPSCQTAVKVKTRAASKIVTCPKCATTLVAGAAPDNAAPLPASPAVGDVPHLELDEPIVTAPVPVASFAPPLSADHTATVPAAQPALTNGIIASPPRTGARLWMVKAQAYMDRGGQATGLDPGTFAALAVGLGAMLLLLIVTCFTWYSFVMNMRLFGSAISEGESYRGISYLEGKLAFIGALAAAVWLGLGIWRKEWLPAAFLAAGAIQTFALVILLGLRSQLAAAFAAMLREQAELTRFISGNPLTKGLEAVSKETDSTFVPAIRGGVGFALILAILLALSAAVALALASRRRPLTVAFFEKPGTPPLLQRYGALAAAYGLAFLLGVIVVVIRH